MKKLILISALLFSFNGWAEDLYTDRPAINLVCKPTQVKLCTTESDCGTYTTERLMRTDPDMVTQDVGFTLRETVVGTWEYTKDTFTRYGVLVGNTIIDDHFIDDPDAGIFRNKKVTHSINLVSGLHIYSVTDLKTNHETIEQKYQCTKTQSLLD